MDAGYVNADEVALVLGAMMGPEDPDSVGYPPAEHCCRRGETEDSLASISVPTDRCRPNPRVAPRRQAVGSPGGHLHWTLGSLLAQLGHAAAVAAAGSERVELVA